MAKSRSCLELFRIVLASRESRSSWEAEQAFSLIELVVVVAILGILTAVSLPALMGNTERARMAAAKAAIQNAVAECAIARQEGRTERELTFPSATTSSGQRGLMTADVVPSLFARPDGFRFDENRGGCSGMYLVPVDRQGNVSLRQGYPILQAKIAARGRVVKAFQLCQPTASTDVTSDCNSWDSTGSVNERDCSAFANAENRENCERANQRKDYSSNREDLNDPLSMWPIAQ